MVAVAEAAVSEANSVTVCCTPLDVVSKIVSASAAAEVDATMDDELELVNADVVLGTRLEKTDELDDKEVEVTVEEVEVTVEEVDSELLVIVADEVVEVLDVKLVTIRKL